MNINDVAKSNNNIRHEEKQMELPLTWIDNKKQEMWCRPRSSAEASLQKTLTAYPTRIL